MTSEVVWMKRLLTLLLALILLFSACAFAEMEDDGESGISQDMLNSMFLTELDLAAVGAELMARDGRKLTLDEYTAYIDKLTEAYPDRTRQQLERENGVETFALERYADYLAQTIDRYVAEAFKKALAK